MGLEEFGKSFFEGMPFFKKILKRIYQRVNYTVSKKTKVDAKLECVTPVDNYEYYYGYYDKSPWDSTNRYIIALRAKKTYKKPAPKENATVIVIDTIMKTIIEIGNTTSWNVQQGAMAQWVGPDYNRYIIYNDFRDGSYCSCLYDFYERKEMRTFSRPIYDVSPNGKYALSLDFSRLHRLRPGYGYSNLKDCTKKEKCPPTCCIWKIDLENGNVDELFTYVDFMNFETHKSMVGAVHKVNHIMISPDSSRFMVLHRWFKNGHKHTRLITVNIDKSDMYNLSDDVFVSHCYWKNNTEILSFLNKNGLGKHYYLMKDKTQSFKLLWPSLNTDGHCSYSPNGKYVITDTYPNKKRMASVYLCSENGNEFGMSKKLFSVFSPFKYDNECRCDLHPRWSRDGTRICIDSIHYGKRGMYTYNIIDGAEFDFENNLIINDSLKNKEYNKIKIVYIFTRLRKSGPNNQTLDLIKDLDKTRFNPVVVTLYRENKDTIIEKFRENGVDYYCLNISRIKSIIKGGKILNEFLKIIKPNLTHSVGMPLYNMARMYSGCDHFTTIHNYCFEDYPVKYGKILGKYLARKDIKIIRRYSDNMVTCSKSLSKMYYSKNNIRINYIQNGVDYNKFSNGNKCDKEAIRLKLQLPKGIIFVFTGQVCKRKNQEFAIKSFIKRNDCSLVVLGNGPDLEKLKLRYEGYSNIIFKGNVSNVDEFLKASDYYISSSKSEGLPIGVLEALATGLPVLLSDIIQHKEILDENSDCGYTFSVLSQDDLDLKIEQLIKSNYEKMSENCIALSKGVFSSKYMTEKYVEIYEKLVERGE